MLSIFKSVKAREKARPLSAMNLKSRMTNLLSIGIWYHHKKRPCRKTHHVPDDFYVNTAKYVYENT